MRISPETVQNKLDTVPEDIRSQVTSDEVAENLSKIAHARGLHIDQEAILNEETLYVMLGLASPEEFVDKLRSRLGIDEGKAVSLAHEINDKIFLEIRKTLMEMHETQEEEERAETAAPEPAQAAPMAPSIETAPQNISTREDILADIENPQPAVHPISAFDQTIPGPRQAAEVTPEDKTAATSFIAGKLSQTVSVPPKKAVFEDRKPPAAEKPKTYSTDPYREPLI